MKTILFTLSLLTTLLASAATKPTEFKLHYRHAGDHLEVKLATSSYEAAIDSGADRCFEFFTSKKKMTKEEKIDLVDVCANPRKA